MKEQVFNNVKKVFREIFKNPNLEIKPGDGAADIAGWDSLTHMTLINELELFFKVSFTFEEISKFKCIEDIVNLITKKMT